MGGTAETAFIELSYLRGHPYMTSAKFWDFLTKLSALGTDLQY